MASSPGQGLIKYIEDQIDTTPYNWVYKEVYEKSLLGLVISIKKLPRYTIKRLNEVDITFTKLRPFYSLICLDFLRRVYEKNKYHQILTYDPSDTSLIDVFLNQAYHRLLGKIRHQLGNEQYNIYKDAIKNIGKDAHFLCWHFFVIANANNLVEKLSEEYYLVQEIDALIKLKE